MTTDELGVICDRVAKQVRRLIPRSSNRYLANAESEGERTDWLKNPGSIEYANFIETMVRTGTKGPQPQQAITVKRKTTVFGIFTKTKKDAASIKVLKQAVLDFIKTEKIDGKPIDTSYKATAEADKAYSTKFGDALATYLNARGYRVNGQPFAPRSVMYKLEEQFAANDRLAQAFGTSAPVAMDRIHGRSADRGLMFPIEYVMGSARNALRYQVGNCEECGCAAFAMLVNWQQTDGTPIAPVATGSTPRVELIHARDAGGDAHFFVLVNRQSPNDILADFDNWSADAKTIVCDPWITDTGVGGSILGAAPGMKIFRAFLNGDDGKSPPKFLAVRAQGWIGGGVPAGKGGDALRLPPA